jgi:hypothetical protein
MGEKDETVSPQEELAGELECWFTDPEAVTKAAADLIKRGWRRDLSLDEFQKE